MIFFNLQLMSSSLACSIKSGGKCVEFVVIGLNQAPIIEYVATVFNYGTDWKGSMR